MRDEKLHAVVARSTFWKLRCRSQNMLKTVQNTPALGALLEVEMSKKCVRRCGAKHISKSKCTKHRSVRTTFGSCDVEKVHAVVARSTFPSQNVQNTAASDHFWKLRCRKSARRCGAKHISKSKCTKHLRGSDHFWKLRCRKSARRCGAKHISKSKVLKTDGLGPLLEVQMSKKCRKSARRCGAKHIWKSKV